jgi:hypothetical protein
MLKRNKTIKWLKTKSENFRKLLLSKARKSVKIFKLKEIAHEQNVLEARKKQLQDAKTKKTQQLQQKKENELNTIKRNVKMMGGLVRSSKDIDSLIKSCKSIRSKKEKLKYQIQYCKHFMNLNIAKSDILWQNTVNQIRSILNLDKPKVLEKCTWVAVSYEDNWYPGEITIKIDNTYTVKFFSRKDARGNTFIWPTKDDLQTIDEKFIIFYDFEILPSPGLTHWIIPEMDEIDDFHQQFVIIDK